MVRDQFQAVPCNVNRPPREVSIKVSGKHDAPASGSAVPHQTSKRQQACNAGECGGLLMWTTSAGMQESDEEDELQEGEECIDYEEEGEESESLDLDPVESGGWCPATPTRALRTDIETPEKIGSTAHTELNDVSGNVQKYYPSDSSDVSPAPLGDVLGDNSCDDCASEEEYCNESEQYSQSQNSDS